MKTAEFIAKEEGFRERAYHDVAGYPTIGFGRKLSDDKWADLSQFPPTTPEAEADHLEILIGGFRATVRSEVDNLLCEDRETALVSLAYNIGGGAFGSSLLVELLNREPRGHSGEHVKWSLRVALEWLDWCKATIDGRKQVVTGLLNRRRREVALFFGV